MSARTLAIAEAVRNVRAAPLRSAIVAGICMLAGAGVAATTQLDLHHVVAADTAQYLAGASTLEVVARDGQPLDALRCHSLMRVDGVIAAGGVMSAESVRMAIEPEADVRLLTTTPGFPVASWPELQSAGPLSVVAASDLARSGLRAGDTVSVSSPSRPATLLHLDAVPQHLSTLGVDRMLLITDAPEGVVSSCLVLAEPASAAPLAALLSDYFDAPAHATPRFLPSALHLHPDQMLHARLSQYGWLIASALCGIALVGGWLARRAEFALYRLLGLPESALLAMFTTEFALLCLAPAQFGLILGTGTHALGSLAATNLGIDILRFDAVLLTLPALAMLILPRASVLATLKGR